MASTRSCNPQKPHVHTRFSLRKPLSCGFAILMCSCLFAGAAQCRARGPQDVAEAARLERARKDHKKSKHVYTDEDLHRATILTPDDEARVAANRKAQPTPSEEQALTASEASTEIAQLPLGDIARRYRDAKRALQAPEPFHLPFDEPVFADPVVSVPDLPQPPPRPSFAPAHPILVPARPHAAVAPALASPATAPTPGPVISLPQIARPETNFSPTHPSVSPVQPHAVVAPVMPSTMPFHRVDPFARRVGSPTPPTISAPAHALRQPKTAAPAIAPSASISNSGMTNVPATPQPGVASTVDPASSAIESLHAGRTVTVHAGDSLWKLAQQNLGRGSRWQELLAANPSIVDPTRIAAGTEIVLPANATGMKSDIRVTVQEGDSLSKIAKATYGRLAAWRCIAQANPEIADANRIYKGQQLLLPFSCQQ
jgi:nucleoid-associated protein YgaU